MKEGAESSEDSEFIEEPHETFRLRANSFNLSEDSEFIAESREIRKESMRTIPKEEFKTHSSENPKEATESINKLKIKTLRELTNQKRIDCRKHILYALIASFTLIVIFFNISIPETPQMVRAKAALERAKTETIPAWDFHRTKIAKLEARNNLSEALLQECLWLSWNSDKLSTHIIGNYTQNLLTDLRKDDNSQMMLFTILDYGLKDPHMQQYMCPLVLRHMKEYYLGRLHGKIRLILDDYCSY